MLKNCADTVGKYIASRRQLFIFIHSNVARVVTVHDECLHMSRHVVSREHMSSYTGFITCPHAERWTAGRGSKNGVSFKPFHSRHLSTHYHHLLAAPFHIHFLSRNVVCTISRTPKLSIEYRQTPMVARDHEKATTPHSATQPDYFSYKTPFFPTSILSS